MGNEYYGAPTTPTSDYLAHYGIKGMKWGVRKAIASGNDRALGRQYRKAQKKLAKLERQAASGKKYAKRAAALGAGAAAAGGLAAAGTLGVAKGIGAAGNAFSQRANSGGKYARRAAALGAGAAALGGASLGVTLPGAKNAAIGANRALAKRGISTGIKTKDIVDAAHGIHNWGSASHNISGTAASASRKLGTGIKTKDIVDAAHKVPGKNTVTNSQLARAGGLAVGAGLLGAAGYNAYRAATTKKAAAKAAQFRNEMNKTFAGTKYANAPRTPQKKRRRG